MSNTQKYGKFRPCIHTINLILNLPSTPQTSFNILTTPAHVSLTVG
jgi:hypothetical protein